MPQSLGEYRVGIEFNPSGDDRVSRIKQQAAALIDTIATIEEEPGWSPEWKNEVYRLRALAMTHIEDGAMWAVKAATKRAPE